MKESAGPQSQRGEAQAHLAQAGAHVVAAGQKGGPAVGPQGCPKPHRKPIKAWYVLTPSEPDNLSQAKFCLVHGEAPTQAPAQGQVRGRC